MPPVNQAQHFGDIHIEGQGQLTINQVVQIAVAEVKTRAFVPGSPYVGLHRFEERNKDFFFGRDRLVEQILQSLLQRNFVLVAGPSGSGKSSVVRAGLIPLLASKFAQGRFRALVLTPDRDPFASLRAALQTAGVAQRQLTGLDARTADSVKSVLTETRPTDERWVVVVDQFEELFTLCSDEKHRAEFILGLTQLAQTAQSELKIVAAMRADFFDRFGPYPTFGALVQQGLQLVLDMEASELRAAIEQPAAKNGVVFEESLVEQIIADVKGRPGALPLLQYTLDLLWGNDKPANDRTLNSSSYHTLGGVAGALQQRADALYEHSDPQRRTKRSEDEKELLRQLFLRVVDLTSQGTDARVVSRRALLADFVKSEEQRLIRELVDEKLLVTNAPSVDKGSPTQSTVEIAHEALLSAWPRLKGWIEQAREVIYVRNRLAADAQRWKVVKTNKPEQAGEELWSGTRLQQAIELRAHGDFATVLGGLTEAETAFLDASVLERERKAQEEQKRLEQLATAKAALRTRTNRFLGLLVVTMAVALVIVVGLYQQAKNEENRAKKQETIATEAKALSVKITHEKTQLLLNSQVERGRELLFKDKHPAQALLWLRNAQKLGSEHADLAGLLDVARTTPGVGFVLNLQLKDKITKASFIANGRHILILSSNEETALGAVIDTSLSLLDATSGKVIRTMDMSKFGLYAISSSPMSPRFATVAGKEWADFSDGKLARVWDANNPEWSTELVGHTDQIISISLSLDGGRAVTGSADGTARVWNGNTGIQLFPPLRGHSGPVQVVKFSQNGQRIITTDNGGMLRLWDASNGKLLDTKKLPSAAREIACSDDASIIVTSTSSGQVLVWNMQKRMPTPIASNTILEKIVRFSPDRKTVVTVAGQRATLWELSRLMSKEIRHADSITSIEFSHNGQYLLSAGKDNIARIWSASSAKLQWEFEGHTSGLISAEFSPDDSHILTASEDGSVRVWPVKMRRNIAAIFALDGDGSNLVGADFSPVGNRVLIRSEDRNIRLWEHQAKNQLRELTTEKMHDLARGWFSSDGSKMLTLAAISAFNEKDAFKVHVWNIDRGLPFGIFDKHTGNVLAATFSPDGRHAATADETGKAYIWSVLDKDEEPWLLEPHNDDGRVLNKLQYRQDGNYLIGLHAPSKSSKSHGMLYEWSLKEKRLHNTIMVQDVDIIDAAYLGAGDLIITANSDGVPRLYAHGQNTPVREFSAHSSKAKHLYANQDGSKFVITTDDGKFHLWDQRSANIAFSVKGYIECGTGFHPSRNQIIASYGDGSAYIYNTDTGYLVDMIIGHSDQMTCASYDHSGTQVVTTGNDGFVKIWNAELLHLDGREIDKFIQCYVPVSLLATQENLLTSSSPDPHVCSRTVLENKL